MANEKEMGAKRHKAEKATREAGGDAAEDVRSSVKGLREGKYARRFLLCTEDDAVFRDFSGQLVDVNRPTDANELQLVETMIHAAWRRRRLSELIHFRINEAVQQALAQNPSVATDAVALTKLATCQLETSGPSLMRQESHEFRLAGIFERSMARLQATRRAAARDRERSDMDVMRRNLYKSMG